MDNKIKVMISGGGTAGHINPAIAIADMLCERMNSENLFIGTESGLENKIVDKEKYDMKYINVIGIKRKVTFENFKVPFILIAAVIKAIKLIKQFKPDVIVGTGGYVSSPVVIAGILTRKKVLLHEQNSYPGIVNRFLGKLATKVFYSFKGSRKYFKKNGIYAGNPLDKKLFKKDNKELRIRNGIDEKPVIIVTTGSRGARSINKLIVKYINEKYEDDFNLIFVTGKRDYEFINNQINNKSYKRLKIFDYMVDRWNYYKMVDLAVIRAGAITLSEFYNLNIPMIIVPYPHATNNHQMHNAKEISTSGGGIIIPENQLSYKSLIETIESIIYNDRKIESMKENLRRIKKQDALEIIYKSIKDILKDGK